MDISQTLLGRLAALVIAGAAIFAPSLAAAQAPPPVPALPDSERRFSVSISNQTGPFGVGFSLYGDSTDYGNWIEVWIITGSGTSTVATKLTAGSDYTLSSPTGSLASIPRPITDAVITLATARTGTLQIVGARRPRRIAQFAENRGVAARDLNQALTDIIAVQRETWDRTQDVIGRTLLTPPGDSIGLLPSATVRAGGVLAFDGSGNPIIQAALTGLGNVVGPNVSVVGHIATFANTSGTLLSDGGLIGAGDFVGPAGAATDHVVTFASGTGKVGKDSGLTLTPSTGTITITNAKTLGVTNSLTLSGTDGTTMTFPTTSATLARTDAANTFTGHQTIEGVTTAGATGTGNLVFATSPTISGLSVNTINKVAITAPATGSTLTIADGKTLTANSTLALAAGADGQTFTFPSSSDTVVTLAAAQTVTAKTITGSTYNGLSISATTGTFSLASNKTLTANNTLTLAGTDATTITFQGTDTYVGRSTTDTLTNKTLTAPTINGGTVQALTNLGVRSTGSGAFDLVLANTENLTAQRALTLTLNNANRTINISGNLTLAADLSTAGGSALTLTTTGATNVTLPTSGTLAAINIAQTFSSQNIFSALTQFSDIKLSSGKIYPTADGTTALQITKADATTRIVNVDTTNARVGINKNAGAFDLDVAGAANIDGALTFGVGTITGLTINNSPSQSNDYLLYYSASANAFRRCTVGSCAAAATAGVSSLNGLTGGLSIASGGNVSVTAASTTVTITGAIPAPGGRLTLQSNVPVMVSSQSAKTTLYYDCYAGNAVPYYNGTVDVLDTIPSCEVSTALQSSGTGVLNSGGVFDVWWSGANHNICVVTNGSGGGWASDTAGSNTNRGSGYSSINRTPRGYFTNSLALTHCYNGATDYGSIGANQATYLGTIYTSAAGQVSFTLGSSASGGTAGLIGLWNMYNRVLLSTSVTDTGTAYSYTTGTVRQARASAGNQISFVLGLQEDTVPFSYVGHILAVNVVGAQGFIGVGFDSTSAFGQGSVYYYGVTTVANTIGTPAQAGQWSPGAGLHTLSANENGDGSHANFFDQDSNNILTATIRM